MGHKIKLLAILIAGLLYFPASGQDTVRRIAFASDTQEPMLVERIFLKSNHNLLATKLIFKDIDTLRPAGLFLMGDVVSSGKRRKAWKNIDKYLRKLRRDSIPVYATLGNHDVMFNAAKGARNFAQRFPLYRPTGYGQLIDSVAVILLNSNFSTMNTAEIAAQDSWYAQQLQAYDQNPAVKFIIVGCHHSPYTNSKVVGPSVSVQQHFVRPFIASKKACLFISGHSHNYERFRMEGKYFVVIGGGGGLHQPLKSVPTNMKDMAADYKPAFHYLIINRTGNSLKILSRSLNSDFSGFKDGLQFDIAKP